MEATTPLTGPVKIAVLGFLGIMGAAIAVFLASRLGLLDPVLAARAMGLIIGIMVIFMGFCLPTLMSLLARNGVAVQATLSERVAGVVLVLAGCVYAVLFVAAPLEWAKSIASVIGIGAIAAVVVILADWAWRARVVLLSGGAPAQRSQAERQKLTLTLIFVFFYVFATACIAYSH